MVDLKPVRSSMLAAIGYDFRTGLLVVLFNNGRAYEYYDVPLEHYGGLMVTDSIGGYMRRHIIGYYRYSIFRGWRD